MITEAQIKAAIKRAPTCGRRSIEMKDDGERGAGRLAVLIRPMTSRVAAEWYAVYYRDGKRRSTKLGSYPTLSLLDARKKFREEYAPAISAGAEPAVTSARNRHRSKQTTISVKALFEEYVESLEKDGQRCAAAVRRILLSKTVGAGRALGNDRAANSITPRDIVDYLSPIHARGATVMARQSRAYVSAAFAYGMKSANDYTRKDTGISMEITSNPVTAVPADREAFRVGTRHLSIDEFRSFWIFLIGYRELSARADTLRLIMATGQRAEEILRISDAVYDAAKQMLYWDKTKNGGAHSIPLPAQAVAILDDITPNKHGWYFPHKLDATKPGTYYAFATCIEAFLKKHPDIPHFTPRDIRRTWKTLSGEAGIAKEWRDRIQNHAKSDVSSKHYDRYEYLPEMRVAINQWSGFLTRLLAGELGKNVVEMKPREGAPAAA